jgi:hypothetical protein
LRLEVAQGRCRKLLKLMSSRETARDGVQVVGGSNPLAPTKNSHMIKPFQVFPGAAFLLLGASCAGKRADDS